jgi:hypothetical protein
MVSLIVQLYNIKVAIAATIAVKNISESALSFNFYR